MLTELITTLIEEMKPFMTRKVLAKFCKIPLQKMTSWDHIYVVMDQLHISSFCYSITKNTNYIHTLHKEATLLHNWLRIMFYTFCVTRLHILKCEIFPSCPTVKSKLWHNSHHGSKHSENSSYCRFYVQRQVITAPHTTIHIAWNKLFFSHF